MDNIGIIFILKIIGQGVTNEIISIFYMLLYQPIGKLLYLTCYSIAVFNMLFLFECSNSINSKYFVYFLCKHYLILIG